MSPPLISLLGRLEPGVRLARPTQPVHLVQHPPVSSTERASLEAAEQERLVDFLGGLFGEPRGVPDLPSRRAAVTVRVDETDEVGRMLDGFSGSLSEDVGSVLDRTRRRAYRALAADTPPTLVRCLSGEAHLILQHAQEQGVVLEDWSVGAVRLDRSRTAQSEQEEA